MSILKNNIKNNFTIINNCMIRDKSLNLTDIGLLAKMLSLPDGWDFSIKGLVAICPNNGEASIRSSLKRIIAAGYLKRYALRDCRGKIIDWIWELSDTSRDCTEASAETKRDNEVEEEKKDGLSFTSVENSQFYPDVDFPQLDNPQLEKPHVENRAQYNTKQINTKELNTKEYKESNRESLKRYKTSIHKIKKPHVKLNPNRLNFINVKKRYRKKFVPPKLEEIQLYIEENKLNVSAKEFFNYYSKFKWIDSFGRKVSNWKQKLLSWNSHSSQKNNQPEKKQSFNNYEQRQYFKEELDRLLINNNFYANKRGFLYQERKK